jgi:hypothetical protein
MPAVLADQSPDVQFCGNPGLFQRGEGNDEELTKHRLTTGIEQEGCKVKKFIKGNKLLVIGIIGILVFSLIACLLQNNFGGVKTIVCNNRTLTEIGEDINANNAITGKNIEVTFTTSDIYMMTYKILKPKNATESTPAPAIVAMHGGLSNKDTYAPVYVELARRGFVVLSFDAMGHGKTDMQVDELTHNTMGMEAMVELAMSLPYVDENNVGVTGHSWGNDGCVNVINSINNGTNNPRIRAFLEAQGSLPYIYLEEGAIDNMLFGFSVGKYDEMDTLYWGAYTLPEGEWANGWLAEIYDGYNETVAPLGVWYTADGPVELAEGTKLDANEARILYNPENTHPAALFSTTAIGVNINFFYGAFGTPAGAKYISSSNQIWPVFVTFLFLALISWFILSLGIIKLLLNTYSFKCLCKGKEKLAVIDANLPTIKDPWQWIPMAIIYVGLVAFSAYTVGTLPTVGSRLIPNSSFFACAAHTGNAYGFWSSIVALVAACALIAVMYVKRFLYRKEGGPTVIGNPFEVAKVPLSEAVYNTFLAFLAFVAAYGVLYIIEAIFGVNYVIATMDYTTVRLNKIPVLFRYCMLFFPFYFVNAVLNANTRYKDIPEWITTAVVCIGNSLGIAIWLFIQYKSLFTTGLLADPNSSVICTTVWSLLLPMVMSPIISRYTYKKTGNVWLGAAFNLFLFTMSLIGTGQYMNYPITIFGL